MVDDRTLFTNFWSKEAKTTRNVLARIPEGSSYRPDPKSRTAQEIAWQIVCEEQMIIDALETGKVEWARPPMPATMKEVLEAYEKQSAGMPDRWSDLLACLELSPVESEGLRLEGRNQDLTYHRLFGGQVLAQLVRASAAAVPGKAVKSLHALFPRAGRSDEPVRYEVQTHHDGGTFATLGVVARQSHGAIAAATVSLHAAEDGPCFSDAFDPAHLPGPEHAIELDLLPWETRSVSSLDTPDVGPASYELWMRTPAVSPDLAPALLAYATDLTLIGTALRPVPGVSQRDAGTAFTSAVTSHTVWFHQPARTDDWLLLRQHSPILAQGRCFGRGDVLTAGGALVASYAQEALLRLSPIEV